LERLNSFLLPATVQIDFADGTSRRSRPRKPLGRGAGRVGGDCAQAAEAEFFVANEVVGLERGAFRETALFPLFSDIGDDKQLPHEPNRPKFL
jgi:hypothetical protein